MAIFGLITPLMVIALADGEVAVRELNRRGCKLPLCIGLAISLPLAIFGKQVLVLFGPLYVEAYPALLILLAGYFVSIAFGLSSAWLQYCGYERLVMKILLVTTLGNIVISGSLIPVYGFIGAAIGTAISMVISALAMVYYQQKYLKFYPWSFSES